MKRYFGIFELTSTGHHNYKGHINQIAGGFYNELTAMQGLELMDNLNPNHTYLILPYYRIANANTDQTKDLQGPASGNDLSKG